ncbi:MAG TPA: hypothetical protein VNI84_11700 [Pyrinomonadaceae bacterium]|nr:hypothetical protein [Pyrinomonadaceae bacterium]
MRNFTILFFLLVFSVASLAQKPGRIKKTGASSKTANSTNAAAGNEKEEFEKAAGQIKAADKIGELRKFVQNFPDSTEKLRAVELIVAARAQGADEKLRAGDAAGAVEAFKLAITEAPAPVGDKLFTEILLQIPGNLFFQNHREAAAQTASLIETKIEGNAKQLLGLATFYLSIENADQAARLAGKAVALEPNLPAAYQTMGIANRLNFDLEAAANAYSKALELDAASIVSKLSLAEMQRAIGKSDEAIALYREILEKTPDDKTAQTGLILSLFDSGKKAEAETETAKALSENPNNLLLLVGASYWYAAHNNGAKAAELAQKALAVEPRYIWAYIALARGLLQENRFTDAERALLAARNYGKFPTLDYELATVRAAAGFYREAARELAKSFVVKDDSITTRLGGRVEKQAKTFIELLAFERRASIFAPAAADNSENSQKLKSLLEFYQTLESPAASDAEISAAADKFVEGADKMKLHRQLFAADRLLEKKKAMPKVAELMRASIGGVDSALNAPGATSAVLADQLFESRSIAALRNEIVIVPEVPRQTLSNILRGRIEEIYGWALYQDDKSSEATVRLKRAVSVLPEKSAWWRSSLWRLGAALQSDGKPKEALDAYLKGYPVDAPDAAKRIIVEGLYKELNGSLDGLDAKIGAKPESIASDFPVQTADAQTIEKQSPNPEPASKAEETQESTEETKPTLAPTSTLEKVPASTPENSTLTETTTKNETKQPETAKNQSVKNNADNTQKPLFEPIIITVPKVQPLVRPRISATNNEAAKPSQCKIITSQEYVSVLKNGGNLGVLVGFENGAGDIEEITASSSSLKDVEAVFEPEIGASTNRAFFIVKSVSENVGVYTMTFEAPCGKKEILVKVR